MLTLARTAYANPGAPVRTDRDTEYDAIARVTSRLKSAEARGPSHFPELVAALHDNRKLWTALASDVAEPGNALPEALRAQILYLAQFIQLHSRKVMAQEAGIDALIEINTAVLRGLRGNGGGPT